ncbi:MAG: Na/Pi cotransporter family protein [Flavobacteriales bacterium]
MKNLTLLFSFLFTFGFSLLAQSSDSIFNDSLVQESAEEFVPAADILHNIFAKEKEGSADISWLIDYDAMPKLESAGYTIIIKYNTKIGAKRDKAGFKNSEWTKVHDIPLSSTHFKLKNLAGGEKYVYKVGIEKGEEQVFSGKMKFETERPWGLFRVLVLIGALGMFIYGMKVMSEGLQQAAGSRLRKMLSSITSNRVKGVLTGFGITSIVQSSSVTTVMTVSFVNAGLLTLMQSAGVMMGANIGTTITAWLINLFGFKVSMANYALVIIAIGAPFLFFGKSKLKAWAAAIIGFALLFMGLGELKGAVPGLDADSPLVQFFAEYNTGSFLSILMFVGLGTIVTVVIQSSSAAMALTMTLVAAGVIPFEVAAAMVLGENIGTTITAELASLIGNVHAKRSARIHSMFNLIGVFWAILLMPFLIDGIVWFMEYIGAGNPIPEYAADGSIIKKDSYNTGIAIFHTTFNLVNVLLLIGFVPQLVRLAERTVKSKGEEDEEFHLEFISAGMMSTPDLSISEAKKEMLKFGNIAQKMNGYVSSLLVEKDNKKIAKLLKKVKKYEEITDRIELEIADYLAKVSQGEMSNETSVRIRGMLSMIGDLERIGDIYYQISKTIESKHEKKVWFNPQFRDLLVEMVNTVDEAMVIMNENLAANYSTVKIDAALSKEKDINDLRDKIRKKHLTEIGSSEYDTVTATFYSNIFHSFEKVGDHIINVTEGLVGNMD